jgi:zinc protease
MTAPGPSKTFVLPAVRVSVLKNGLKIYAVSRHELPLISLHLILPYGAETDPPDRAGLCDLTAEMLTLGTRRRSAARLAAEVDGMGAVLSAHSGWNATSIRLFGLSEDWARLLDLLLEVTTEPAFSPEEFAQLKQRRIAALFQQKDESQIQADERFEERLFSGTPYGHPTYGTLQSLPALATEDAQNFYRDHFLPPGSFAVMVGDLDVDSCCRWLEDHFPSLGKPQEEGEAVSPAPAKISAGIRTFIMDRPDLTQTQIRFGHAGIPHAHPDYPSFEVMNYILGAGGFSSRLMQRIRSDLGYTYGIRSSLEARKYAGPFVISTFTPTETTFPCIQEIFSVLRSFLDQGATEQERQEALNFLVGSYPRKFETLSQIAQKIIQVELHGLGLEELSAYPQKISSIGREEIAQAARSHLHPEGMVGVIVGRAEAFRQKLEDLGPVEMIE